MYRLSVVLSQRDMQTGSKLFAKILTNIQLDEEWFDEKLILQAIRKDKKQTNKEITAVFIQKDHSLGVYRDVKPEEIMQAVKHVISM